MNPRISAVLIVGAALGVNVVTAEAGPCTKEIAQFEQAVRQSARNPDIGPTAPQSIGAQLHREPTPGSVKQAEESAQTRFGNALSRAKRLDATGKRAECLRALAKAKSLFDLQ